MKKILPVILLFLTGAGCMKSFIKDSDLMQLEKRYEGVYILIKDTSIGNRRELKAGTKVRLYFTSGKGSVKVYAYSPDEDRETALGDNILYLFESDFPDNVFDDELFEMKLFEVVKKAGR